ncbi:MAG TPA: V-type ATP synthase subunit F [Methanoregulaceae archaeon]|jgi:V/A-type H+-transporting ATPase subunit F|nr:V-type ATP synthase subunit F [Methanoregulaceae archaeon]HOV67349.1 V-type ATP synthase subunit F [Methanoregulaceae archaeon]HQJ88584.1 V-type ATP synthase subunit F [Methanoregulaceae archaeon]
MYRFVVLTEPDTAAGFRMAGVETLEATSAGEARALLASLMQDKETGIVAVNEDFMQDLDERLSTRIQESTRPIVIPIPGRSRLGGGMTAIEQLLRRAIGYSVVLRR